MSNSPLRFVAVNIHRNRDGTVTFDLLPNISKGEYLEIQGLYGNLSSRQILEIDGNRVTILDVTGLEEKAKATTYKYARLTD